MDLNRIINKSELEHYIENKVKDELIVKNNDISISESLLSSFDSLLKTKCIYTQFRNQFDLSYLNSVFNKLDFNSSNFSLLDIGYIIISFIR